MVPVCYHVVVVFIWILSFGFWQATSNYIINNSPTLHRVFIWSRISHVGHVYVWIILSLIPLVSVLILIIIILSLFSLVRIIEDDRALKIEKMIRFWELRFYDHVFFFGGPMMTPKKLFHCFHQLALVVFPQQFQQRERKLVL